MPPKLLGLSLYLILRQFGRNSTLILPLVDDPRILHELVEELRRVVEARFREHIEVGFFLHRSRCPLRTLQV